MIVVYIILGILLFLLLFLAFVLFVPFKTYIQGSFREADLNAVGEFYWIKYLFGARVKFLDMDKLKILIWIFAIPIPLTMSLKKEKKEDNKPKNEEARAKKTSIEGEKKPLEKSEEKENFRERIDAIIKVKNAAIRFYTKNQADIRKIFVTYVTFSIEYFELELGLGDPAKTGKMAGKLYTALAIVPVEELDLSWNFQKKTLNTAAGIKISMKFYGILITLLKLYRFYKKDK
ncbi:MAG: hypothetical protein WCT23_06250 [Candidatus Neomarinimicrobiota bacterium]